MTTRLDLRNLCRRRLGDLAAPYRWSDLQLNQWINDALAEASLAFPRQLRVQISTTSGLHTYDLPEGFQAALAVVYPEGVGAPRLLEHLASTEYDFYELPGRYDVLRSGSNSQLLLSDSPLSGETIQMDYLSDHAWLDDDGDACTLADALLELVALFVRWASLQELASQEASDPDPGSIAISLLEAHAGRAEAAYRSAIQRFQRASAESARVHWRMDGYDPIY